jgi:hypothetical protein
MFLELTMRKVFEMKSDLKKNLLIIVLPVLIAAITFLTGFPVSVTELFAAEVTLEWDKNPEADIAGYKIHYGLESGDYTTNLDVRNYTTCVVDGLEAGHTYYFAATAYNTAGVESNYSDEINHTVEATYEPPAANVPPTSSAGSDQTVDAGSVVTLNGSGSSDPDDGIASYYWAQTSGPSVNLSSRTVVRPTFTAPDVYQDGVSLSFRLTVTDRGGLQSSDSCTVYVSYTNLAPSANAGSDQTVDEGTAATLNGSGSQDPDGGIASYRWSQTAGPSITLSSMTAANPSFTAPNIDTTSVTLSFRLTVTDSEGLQSSDACNVTVQNVETVETSFFSSWWSFFSRWWR